MLANQHTLLDVLVDLPTVGRMDFLDVDREEVDAISIGAVDAIEGPSLGPKWRSGIAPKDERDRATHETLRESNRLALVQTLTGQIG